MQTLRLGIAGLGRAFLLMRPTLELHPALQLTAAADPRAEAREAFARDFGGRSYTSVEDMCADPNVDAIYVATPHQFHAANVAAAAAHGKHVLVEKPMALSLEDCAAMTDAATRAGVAMVIGHSHSFDAPIARAAGIIGSGSAGAMRMMTALNYTDFLYRPRRPEELSTASGGGVIFNQAPHHVDVARLLGGGMVKSVRAITGSWDPARPTEGAYTALLLFENGATASLTYSGYAHFDSDALTDWIGEGGQTKDPAMYGVARAALRGKEESALKRANNYGGAKPPPPRAPLAHAHFGPLIVSCERADLRPTPHGIHIYDDAGERFEAIPPPAVPRGAVIDEFLAAIHTGRPTLHNGEWGLATMEVCLAMLTSARDGRDIALSRQVPAL